MFGSICSLCVYIMLDYNVRLRDSSIWSDKINIKFCLLMKDPYNESLFMSNALLFAIRPFLVLLFISGGLGIFFGCIQMESGHCKLFAWRGESCRLCCSWSE